MTLSVYSLKTYILYKVKSKKENAHKKTRLFGGINRTQAIPERVPGFDDCPHSQGRGGGVAGFSNERRPRWWGVGRQGLHPQGGRNGPPPPIPSHGPNLWEKVPRQTPKAKNLDPLLLRSMPVTLFGGV